MAGKLIKVLPKTTFDFTTGVASLSGSTAQFILGDPVELTGYNQVGIVARLHSSSIASGATIVVGLLADGFLNFSNFSYNGQSITAVVFGSGNAAPTALFALGNSVGTFGSVYVSGSTSATGQTLFAVISVDVWVRNADPIDEAGRSALLRASGGWSLEGPRMVTVVAPKGGCVPRQSGAYNRPTFRE